MHVCVESITLSGDERDCKPGKVCVHLKYEEAVEAGVDHLSEGMISSRRGFVSLQQAIVSHLDSSWMAPLCSAERPLTSDHISNQLFLISLFQIIEK